LTILETASRELSRLTIGFVAQGDLSWCLGELDWKGLDHTISRFRGLKMLSFVRQPDEFSDEEVCVVRKCVEKLSVYRDITVTFGQD
jgi:hypothetical protein